MSAPETNARSPAPRTTITCTSGSRGERAEDPRHRDLHVVRHRVEARRVVVRHPADAVLHVGEHLLGAGVDRSWSSSRHCVASVVPTAPDACSVVDLVVGVAELGQHLARVRAVGRRTRPDASPGVSLNVSGGRSTSIVAARRVRRPAGSAAGAAPADRRTPRRPRAPARTARCSASRSTHSAVVRVRSTPRDVGVELGAVREARREVGVARIVGELGRADQRAERARSRAAPTR